MTTNTPVPSDRLLKIVDAADALSISRSMLYELLADGLIKSIVIGRRCRRIPSSEIERFISANLSGEAR